MEPKNHISRLLNNQRDQSSLLQSTNYTNESLWGENSNVSVTTRVKQSVNSLDSKQFTELIIQSLLGYQSSLSEDILNHELSSLTHVSIFGEALNVAKEFVEENSKNPNAYLRYRLCDVITMKMDSISAFIGKLDAEKYKNPSINQDIFREIHQNKDFMIALVDIICLLQDSDGGLILTQLYNLYTENLGPLRDCCYDLLIGVLPKFFHVLYQWIFDGILDDPNKEFFILENRITAKDHMWSEMYNIRIAMLPPFVTDSEAEKILITGKSLNFLKNLCVFDKNIEELKHLRKVKMESVADIIDPYQRDKFSTLIDKTFHVTGTFVMDVLKNNYMILDHIQAIRQFLLLGQGDFVISLIDNVFEDLSSYSDQLSRVGLMGHINAAIKDSNARFFHPEIIDRLDFSLRLVNDERVIGWDCFSLTYLVDGPLKTLFTEEVLEMHHSAFIFLFRFKRVEFSLSNIWLQQLNTNRLKHNVGRDLSNCFLHFRTFLKEVKHLILQMTHYINVQVLECAWSDMFEKVSTSTSLDAVLRNYQEFLNIIYINCFLEKKTRENSWKILSILETIMLFIRAFEELIGVAEAEEKTRIAFHESYSKKKDVVVKKQEILRRNKFKEDVQSKFMSEINVIMSSYRKILIPFLIFLSEYSDDKISRLVSKLNYNEFYNLEVRDNVLTIAGDVLK